jgi:hypothetical protein
MIGVWDFFQHDDGRWGWRYEPREKQTAAASTERFSTRSECIIDAMKHGYLTHTGNTLPPWPSR